MNFTKLDLVQGTPEWLDARYDFVTASQAPVLFDLSPYQTILGLFEEKVLRRETQDTKGKEVLFARGHQAEANARIYLEKNLNLVFEPAVMISKEHPYLMASLDGYIVSINTILECKLVGAEALKKIRNGEIPPHHMCQMQAALLVSNAAECMYFVSDTSGDSHMVSVKADVAYQNEIALAAKSFMEKVKAGEPPEPGERDFFTVENDARFVRYESLDAQIKALESEQEALRVELLGSYKDHTRVRGGAVTIVKSIRKGAIDYKKVPVLKGVDLEKYRKASSEVTTIKVSSNRNQLRGVA